MNPKSTPDLSERARSIADERSDMLNHNRDADDQMHYDKLGEEYDRVATELLRRGVRW